jgi:SNF2 family DNA or RNA helicase
MKTYGTITYDNRRKCLKIEAQPHVILRLKRVFPKINAYESGNIFISKTAEICYDLKWFATRYPLIIDPSNLLDEKADEYNERQTLVDKLISGLVTPLQFNLKKPPRDYQALATQLWHSAKGLLVADDVGLGKTLVALAGMNELTLPSLVVVQSHLTEQWQDKVEEFTDLSCHILRKTQPYDLSKYTKGVFPDIIISNYHKLHGWAETISPLIKSVVFDECQELRHQGTNKYSAAKYIAERADFRLGLSATPIYNYGGEIYNVVDILMPDAMGQYEEFRREWCSYEYDKPKIKEPRAFGLYMREAGLMLRRTRKEVKRELPPVIYIPHHIEADLDILDAVKGEAIELAKLILKQTQDFKGQKMQAAGEFDLKLRQATGIAKAPYVAEFVKLLIEETGKKVLIFAHHHAVYDILKEKLRQFNPVFLTGKESIKQKEESKQRFIHGDSGAMIMNLRSGAGTDGLQDVCDTVVFAELDWSGSVHEQDIGRINRDKSDGSPCDPAVAYFMISNSGSDPTMVDILGIKKGQLEGIRDPNADLVSKTEIDPQHIRKLAESFLLKHGIKPEEFVTK